MKCPICGVANRACSDGTVVAASRIVTDEGKVTQLPLLVPKQHDRFGGAGYKGNVTVFDPRAPRDESAPAATVVVATAPSPVVHGTAEVSDMPGYAEMRTIAAGLGVPAVGVKKLDLWAAIQEAQKAR